MFRFKSVNRKITALQKVMTLKMQNFQYKNFPPALPWQFGHFFHEILDPMYKVRILHNCVLYLTNYGNWLLQILYILQGIMMEIDLF